MKSPSKASSPVHASVLECFATLMKSGRLAHAYIFIGPKGIGKTETARAVAKLLNCQKETAAGQPCDCPSCRKIDHGNHPDIFTIRREEEKSVIAIEQFRDLIERLQLRPVEARYKVCIVEEADQVQAAAANSFLKTLEEPHPDTVIILTTSVPEAVLKTVLSRCHQIFFFPLGKAELAQWLQFQYHVESSASEVLAKLAEGSPGRAQELGADYLNIKNEMIDRFVLARSDESVIKTYTSDKDTAGQLLSVLLTFFKDILLAKRGVQKAIVHTDRMADIQRLAQKYSDDDLGAILDQTIRARKGLKENMNVKVAVTLLREMI